MWLSGESGIPSSVVNVNIMRSANIYATFWIPKYGTIILQTLLIQEGCDSANYHQCSGSYAEDKPMIKW